MSPMNMKPLLLLATAESAVSQGLTLRPARR